MLSREQVACWAGTSQGQLSWSTCMSGSRDHPLNAGWLPELSSQQQRWVGCLRLEAGWDSSRAGGLPAGRDQEMGSQESCDVGRRVLE